MAEPLIIAHRGASARAPENTLAAIEMAWQLQADAVEIDVHLSKDGHIMVMHDADTLRTTGVASVIEESDFNDLRQLDAGRWKGAQWAGQRIPLLREVLATMPPAAKIFIEIKCGRQIISALQKLSLNARQARFISFDGPLLAELKQRMPAFEAYLIFDDRQRRLPFTKWMQLVDEYGLDGLDANAAFPLTPEMMRLLNEQNKKIVFWTVDDPRRARQLCDLGVAGITTNRPGYLRQKLEK